MTEKTTTNTQAQATSQSPTMNALQTSGTQVPNASDTVQQQQRIPAKKIQAPIAIALTTYVDPIQPLIMLREFKGDVKLLTLPKTMDEIKQHHYVPFPIGVRYLMVQSAIPYVTQLPTDEIANPDYAAKDESPRLRYPIPDCEYLHLLLLHPRAEEYNNWKTYWMPAPEILSTHIAVSLRRFQLNYIQFALADKTTKVAREAKIALRLNWKELPAQVQQWILQMLAPKPGVRPTYLSPDNVRWGDDATYDHSFLAVMDNAQYLNVHVTFWDKWTEEGFHGITHYPHEGVRHDKFLTAHGRRAIEAKRKQLKITFDKHAEKERKSQVVDDVTTATSQQLVNNNNLSDLMMHPPKASQTQTDVNMTQDTTQEYDEEDDADDDEAGKKDDDDPAFTQLEQDMRDPHLPPRYIPGFKPLLSVYYWSGPDEYHRHTQWMLERAWYKAQAEGRLDATKWDAVSRRAHAGRYTKFEKLYRDLLKQAPQQLNYRPVRGFNNPFQQQYKHRAGPTPQPPGQAPTPRARHQQQQRRAPPPPQQAPQEEKQARATTNADTTTYYNNPKTPQEMAQNIHTAFATGTVPPRVHQDMPTDPTGTIQTPANQTTRVDTRYPNDATIPTNSFFNFSSAQLTDVDRVLGTYGHGVPQSTRQRAAQNDSAQNTIFQQASAQQVASLIGPALATAAVTDKAFTNLLHLDYVAPFENFVAQYFKATRKLVEKTASQQKALLLQRKIEAKYIIETLQFIFDLIDKHRANLASGILVGTTTLTDINAVKQIKAERQKTEVKHLIKLVKVDIVDREVPGIIDALTQAFVLGWKNGHMPLFYQQQPKPIDKILVAKQVAQYMPAPTAPPTNNTQNYTPRGRGRGRWRGRGRGRGQQGRGAASQGTQQGGQQGGGPTRPGKLYTKQQRATPIFSEPDAQLGQRIAFTRLKYVSSYCNNFQIWGHCAIYQQDKTRCTFKHKCSNCGDQTHPRRLCPKDLPGEDRYA